MMILHVSRQGTVLIMVAGLSALLASLALAFLARNRADAEESRLMVQEVQARLMLSAACNYIQECSRIGWDRYWEPGNTSQPTAINDPFPGSTVSPAPVRIHEETFGWLDVRDGNIGPKTQEGRVCFDANTMVFTDAQGVQRPGWPAPNSVVRCPMHVWTVPRWATTLKVCYNPINTDSANQVDGDYLWPYLRYPDPEPHGSKREYGQYPTATARAEAFGRHRDGQKQARQHTVGKSWFRILRDGPTTFLVTCGAGGSLGHRSWTEVVQQGDAVLFNNDPSLFEVMRSQEVRLWYRVEWSASSTELTYHWDFHHRFSNTDTYMQWPMNASHAWMGGCRSPSNDRNFGGSIRWLQRLRSEPTYW